MDIFTFIDIRGAHIRPQKSDMIRPHYNISPNADWSETPGQQVCPRELQKGDGWTVSSMTNYDHRGSYEPNKNQQVKRYKLTNKQNTKISPCEMWERLNIWFSKMPSDDLLQKIRCWNRMVGWDVRSQLSISAWCCNSAPMGAPAGLPT